MRFAVLLIASLLIGAILLSSSRSPSNSMVKDYLENWNARTKGWVKLELVSYEGLIKKNSDNVPYDRYRFLVSGYNDRIKKEVRAYFDFYRSDDQDGTWKRVFLSADTAEFDEPEHSDRPDYEGVIVTTKSRHFGGIHLYTGRLAPFIVDLGDPELSETLIGSSIIVRPSSVKNFGEFRKGDVIKVWTNGDVMLSNPGQVDAIRIEKVN